MGTTSIDEPTVSIISPQNNVLRSAAAMKITCLILGAVLCLGLASASGTARQLRMLVNSQRKLEEQKKGKGEGRCACEDGELLAGFVSTLGNLVATCEINRLWEIVFSEEGEEEGYDFYAEGCDFLREIGENYEAGEYEDEISTCGEVKEGLVAFHCLNTYMSIAEMNVARNEVEEGGTAVETAKLVSDLEAGMKWQCDSLYHSPECLVMHMTEDPDKDSCHIEAAPAESEGSRKLDIKSLTQKIRRMLGGNK